jgi:hypothetical protein
MTKPPLLEIRRSSWRNIITQCELAAQLGRGALVQRRDSRVSCDQTFVLSVIGGSDGSGWCSDESSAELQRAVETNEQPDERRRSSRPHRWPVVVKHLPASPTFAPGKMSCCQ